MNISKYITNPIFESTTLYKPFSWKTRTILICSETHFHISYKIPNVNSTQPIEIFELIEEDPPVKGDMISKVCPIKYAEELKRYEIRKQFNAVAKLQMVDTKQPFYRRFKQDRLWGRDLTRSNRIILPRSRRNIKLINGHALEDLVPPPCLETDYLTVDPLNLPILVRPIGPTTYIEWDLRLVSEQASAMSEYNDMVVG